MQIKSKAERKAYMKEYYATWYQKNKEKRKKQIIEYQKTKPEGWQKAIGRKCHLKQRYNVTPQEYKSMLEAQEYKCAICSKDASENKRGNKIESLYIDHCHVTKQVRGLLCHTCNTGLGHFKDKIENLMKAIDYLRKHML